MEENQTQEENVTKVDLKKKPEETVYKVDLTKKDDVEESTTDDTVVVGSDEATEPTPKQEEVQAESETQESQC